MRVDDEATEPPPPADAAATVDVGPLVAQLVAMGFPEGRAARALEASELDVQAAALDLISSA